MSKTPLTDEQIVAVRAFADFLVDGMHDDAIMGALESYLEAEMTLTLSSGHTLNRKALNDIAEQTGLDMQHIAWGIEYGIVCGDISGIWLDNAVPILNGERDYDEDTDFPNKWQTWAEDPLISLDDALLQFGAGDIESEEEFRDLCQSA